MRLVNPNFIVTIQQDYFNVRGTSDHTELTCLDQSFQAMGERERGVAMAPQSPASYCINSSEAVAAVIN